jgi:hypothetical protein
MNTNIKTYPSIGHRMRILERYYYQREPIQQIARDYDMTPQEIRLMCYRLVGMGKKEAQLKKYSQYVKKNNNTGRQ